MCGIAGIVDRKGAPVDRAVVDKMVAALAHRGPDGEGSYVNGSVGLGHRRLAILDLSAAGDQPMRTSDGDFAITYNGEVYNFSELRAQLEAEGHSFRSRTDTEVVLTAWARWGAASVERLNGMFAFAIYDRRAGEVTLVRDRYGVKPLYYALVNDQLLFGSEVKALLNHPSLRADLDREAMIQYFTFQNFLDDRTLFSGVRLLPAGSMLKVPLRREAPLGRHQYWDFDFTEPEQAASRSEYVEELARLFDQAVERQLVSDVSVSSYLSGGMDTGAITAVASRRLSEMRTFTVGFDTSSASGLELGFDERPRAERLSYLCGTEHYEMVLKAGDLERAMPMVVRHMEEPRVGQSYPNFYAAKLAGSFDKVVLSGAGGDELFAGYPWRYYRAVVNDDFEHYVDKYYRFWQRLLPEGSEKDFFGPMLDVWADVDPRSLFASVLAPFAGEVLGPEDYINHSLYFEAKTFLHGLLVVEDKLSMAHGLETRVPFLDNDLVDFAMGVPVDLKLGNLGEVVRLNENEPGPKTAKYFAKTNDGKLLLREAMSRYIPDDITSGPKQGFSAPDASWFRGESIDYVRRTLLGSSANVFEYLDRETVHELVESHVDGRQNRRLLIWSLLYLEEWINHFVSVGS